MREKRFVLNRIARVVPLVVIISIITFSLLHLAPGGPVGVISHNPKITGDDLDRIRDIYGLNRTLPVQYLCWFRQVFLRFDFGASYASGRPVSEMIAERLPATLELMGLAFIVALVAGIGLGVASALDRGGTVDQLLSLVSTAGMSMPVFWIGLMAIALFSLKLGILPAGGRGVVGESASFTVHVKHLVLPVLVLAFGYLASFSRYMKAGMDEAIRGEYIRTARAKGLRERVVIFKHAFRNAVLPVITIVAMQIPTLFTGAVITETVFSWPGMGRLFYEGLQRHDYTRILGIVVISSLLIILFNFVGDILSILADPRMYPQAEPD